MLGLLYLNIKDAAVGTKDYHDKMRHLRKKIHTCMEESKDYIMKNFALCVTPDYNIQRFDSERNLLQNLQKVYSWNESYKDSTKIDNEFDFDVAGQYTAYMYKIKVVNYIRIQQDDGIHWQTKIHDFQNRNKPVHKRLLLPAI